MSGGWIFVENAPFCFRVRHCWRQFGFLLFLLCKSFFHGDRLVVFKVHYIKRCIVVFFSVCAVVAPSLLMVPIGIAVVCVANLFCLPIVHTPTTNGTGLQYWSSYIQNPISCTRCLVWFFPTMVHCRLLVLLDLTPLPCFFLCNLFVGVHAHGGVLSFHQLICQGEWQCAVLLVAVFVNALNVIDDFPPCFVECHTNQWNSTLFHLCTW